MKREQEQATKRETVLVTGAAGTVGGYLVRELVEKGCRVIAHDRPGSRFDFGLPEGAPVELRQGDLRELAACVDAVKGADSIVHVAAVIDLAIGRDEMMAINRDAVRSLYQSARAAGCRRFVFVSSGSIYKKTGGPIPEDRELAPQTAYEESKAQAESYLFDRPHGETDVVVLRPSMIYGPRARFLAAKLATLPPMLALVMERIPVFDGGPVCNYVHAEDVARAAAFVLDEPRAAWQAFNVADETPMSFGEVLETITTCYGLPLGARIPYPMAALKILGPAMANSPTVVSIASPGAALAWKHVVARFGLDPAIDGALDRETLLYSAIEAIFDTTRLQALGFRVKHKSLREGYPEVLRWFQEHRWLPIYDQDAQRPGVTGVRFAETMAGTWHREPGSEERLFRFTVSARGADLRRFVSDGTVTLDGTLDAGGLGTARHCRGTLAILPFSTPRTLTYDLAFDGDDQRRYHFHGAKTLELLHLVRTMTTLPGTVTDADGHEVGSCLLRFDLRADLLSFLGSFALDAGAADTAPIALPAVTPTPARAKKHHSAAV